MKKVIGKCKLEFSKLAKTLMYCIRIYIIVCVGAHLEWLKYIFLSKKWPDEPAVRNKTFIKKKKKIDMFKFKEKKKIKKEGNSYLNQ